MKLSKSALLVIGATLILSLTKVLIKSLAVVPASQIAFLRAIFILAITYPVLRYKQIKIFNEHWKILVLRGVFGTTGMFLLFYLVQTTPLATSTSLFYLAPIFTSLIAFFLIKEKTPLSKWLCFCICFIGVLLVKSFSADLSATEFSIAVVAAISAAFAYNMIRLLKGKTHPLLIVFYLPLLTAPMIGYWAITNWVSMNSIQWLCILGICTGAYAMQILLTLAYQNTPAHQISHFSYLGIPLGVFWGLAIFDEVPESNVVFGILLILTGLLLSHFTQRKTKVLG